MPVHEFFLARMCGEKEEEGEEGGSGLWIEGGLLFWHCQRNL